MQAIAPAPTSCIHCGTLVQGMAYCCAGCEAAAALLTEAGLASWYSQREAPAPRPQVSPVDWTHVQGAPGQARLAIDGLSCASCVWVIERLLERTPGVQQVMVSYATGHARLRWDPDQTDLATLAGRIAALGYRPRPLDRAERPDHDALVRLGVAAFCTANAMTLAAALYVGWWEGMTVAWADRLRWFTWVFATPVAVWCAAPFHLGALRGLGARTLHMDLPISLAVVLLYAHGTASLLAHTDSYLDSLTMLVTLLLVGRALEARGRSAVGEATAALSGRLPSSARRVRPGGFDDVDPSELRPGDQVDVPAGSEIPADGHVVEGEASVDRSLLTGESEPARVGPGDEVVASSVTSGALRVLVTAAGEATVLQQMVRAMEERTQTAPRSEHTAAWFTGLTLTVAMATAAAWMAIDPSRALPVTVSVLVVACPCAVALARPLTHAAASAALAQRGVLLRSSEGLARLAEVGCVAFDKTGTLTGGTPEVVAADADALRIAAALACRSAHPASAAVVREAIERSIPIPPATQVVEVAGTGMVGLVDGRRWTLGAGERGSLQLTSGEQVHTLELCDVVREDAASTIDGLRALGQELVVLTGDRQEPARAVAASLGVEVLAEMTGLAKRDWVRQHPVPVLFVGDGLNDGPALSVAHASLAMGHGATSSVLAADGVVLRGAVAPVVDALRIARKAMRAERRSVKRSAAYNVLAVLAASAGLINPLVAALLMPISSLAVLHEAWRLRKEA